MNTNSRPNISIIFAMMVLLLVFAGLIISTYYFFNHSDELLLSFPQKNSPAETFLPDDTALPSASVNFRDIPSWLFIHVAIIASLQVLSVLVAAMKASKSALTSRQLAVIQFLIEIPMYLGLFGTLMGVCLTQFISGTLVAPLAYLTTMSGILLHVFGKLTIWLALAADEFAED